MLFHLKVYDDPVLLKAQKKEEEEKKKEAMERWSVFIITTMITTGRKGGHQYLY